MMDAETWLNAQQALDLGLIDAVQTFEAQAAEAQTMVQAMPAPQQEQYQTIVNKFKNQTKTTMQTPENKTEEQIGKSFVAWFKGLFVNQTAPEAVATPTPEPIAEVTPTPEVIAVKAIADMTDEEIEAEAAKRKAQKTAAADPAVAALEAKIKAMEQDLALHKAKAIVPQNAAPVAKEMNDAQKKAYAFLDRIKSCPDVAKSFNASNQN